MYQASDVYEALLFFFQAEDGIRYLVRSRGLGDVYKRQILFHLLMIQDSLKCGLSGADPLRRATLGKTDHDLSLIHI